MAVPPIPSLTLAAPSQSSASTPFNTPFAVGGGATAGGIPSFVWLAALIFAGLYLYKKG